MAKSMRSKREKRLRAIRRELVEPLYDAKDVAKLAAQEAALAAPKLPVRPSPSTSTSIAAEAAAAITSAMDLIATSMDVEMDDGNQSMAALKPVGGIGKKAQKKFKMAKAKRRGRGKGKGNIGRKHV